VIPVAISKDSLPLYDNRIESLFNTISTDSIKLMFKQDVTSGFIANKGCKHYTRNSVADFKGRYGAYYMQPTHSKFAPHTNILMVVNTFNDDWSFDDENEELVELTLLSNAFSISPTINIGMQDIE
jgi:hypothetical protein